MLVRHASLSDARSIHETALRTFPMACPPEADGAALEAYVAEAMSEERFREIIQDSGRVVLCGLVDGDLAGFAVVKRATEIPHGRALEQAAELEKLYVCPVYHGTGLANQLLSSAFDAASEAGAKNVVLGVYSGNDRAKHFYAKFGFVETGYTKFIVGSEAHLDSIMVATLA